MKRNQDFVPLKIAKKATRLYRKIRLVQDIKTQIKDASKQKENVTDALQKEKRNLKSMQAKVAHYSEIYSGLEELKNIQKLTPKQAQQKVIEVLTHEVNRLEKLVEQQRETISKQVYTNPLINLEMPTFQKTLHPIKFFKNLKEYNHEKMVYKTQLRKTQIAEINFTLGQRKGGVHIQNNGKRQYKPHAITAQSNYIELGDRLIATYYLADFPAYVSPYAFFQLLTSSLPFTISVFVEPSVKSDLVKLSRQRLSVLQMQQKDKVSKGKLRDQELDKNLEETTQFIEELVHETEKGIIYSLYLSLEGETKEDLKKLHKELKNITDSMEFTFSRYTYGQKKAFEATLPFHTDTIKQNKLFQSTAASYLMPFVSKQFSDPDGIFLGINAYQSSLVFVNPFTVRNSNVNILGVSGAGKSVTAKTLATRLYMRGTQVIIIDPEGEYVNFAKALGGEIIQFSRKNGINPFSLHITSEEEMLDHIGILKTFFKFFIPDRVYDGAVLDEVLVKLYKKGNVTFDSFLKSLEKDPMYKYLNVLNEGSLQGVFNAKRELQLDNDLIVFDISPLGDTEKKAPAMYLLTSLIWQLVNKKSDRKRMLFIDEAHKLLIDREVAIFYREMVKQARKRNLGVVSITQDVEDFLHGEFGKAILTNSETKILLKQSYATLGLMNDIFPMTNEEKQQLGSLGVGEVVLFRENEHIRVDIFVLPREEQFILPNASS